MASKLEKLDDGRVKLTINVDPATFEEGINKTYRKMKGRFAVSGFRKGKVPRKIIENHYGQEVFYEDTFFDEILPLAYSNAIKENGLKVVSRLKPDDINVLKMNPESGVNFSVTVTLKPDVILGEYTKIPAKKTIRKVEDKDVDAKIEKIREQNARWFETDEAAANGDTVIIDYSGSIDGEKFAGGTADNQSVIIGSERFIPGFEKQLIGVKKNDEKVIDVTFPEVYHPEVAGKDAVFTIKVKEVKKKELPDLDDDFAQDISEYDTLEAYKSATKDKMQKLEDEREKIDVENQVLRAVTENAMVNIPEVMIENHIDNQIEDLRYKLQYQGVKLEDYLKYMGNSLDELKKGYRKDAEEQVKMRLVVEALIDKLNIELTDEQTDDYIKKYAQRAKKDLEEYKKDLSHDDYEFLKEQATMESLFNYLVDNAVIEEISEPYNSETSNKNDISMTEEMDSGIMSYADDDPEEGNK